MNYTHSILIKITSPSHTFSFWKVHILARDLKLPIEHTYPKKQKTLLLVSRFNILRFNSFWQWLFEWNNLQSERTNWFLYIAHQDLKSPSLHFSNFGYNQYPLCTFLGLRTFFLSAARTSNGSEIGMGAGYGRSISVDHKSPAWWGNYRWPPCRGNNRLRPFKTLVLVRMDILVKRFFS